MSLGEIHDKVDEILTILRRIESRQIKTTAMVEEVKEHEPPAPVGLYQKE